MDQLFFGICAVLGLMGAIGIVAGKVRTYMFESRVTKIEKEEGARS